MMWAIECFLPPPPPLFGACSRNSEIQKAAMPPPASTSDGHRMNVCAYAFVRSTVVEAAGEPLFWCSSSSPVRRCDAVLSTSMETERARLQAVVFDLPEPSRHAVRGTAIAITGTLYHAPSFGNRALHLTAPSLARKFSPIACHTEPHN